MLGVVVPLLPITSTLLAGGTAWADVPDGWCCPDRGVQEKVGFLPVEPSRV